MPRVCWSRGNTSYQFRSLPSRCREFDGLLFLAREERPSGTGGDDQRPIDTSFSLFTRTIARATYPGERRRFARETCTRRYVRGTAVFSRVHEIRTANTVRLPRLVPTAFPCPRNLRVHAQPRLSFVSRRICRTRLSLAHTRHARKQSDSLIRSLARSFSLSFARLVPFYFCPFCYSVFRVLIGTIYSDVARRR